MRDSFSREVLVVKGVSGPSQAGEDLKLKENPVKRALHAGKPQIGTWLSLGSIAAARFMARAGFPWLTVDMEHTHTDIQTAAFMFGAIADAGCVPLARIPTGKHEYIKMVLDCGAMGIVAPMVMDAAEAEGDRRRHQVPSARQPVRRRRHARPELRRDGRGILQQSQRRNPGHHPDRAHQGRRDRRSRSIPCPASMPCSSVRTTWRFSMKAADGTSPSKEVFEATLTRIREAAQRNKLPCGLHVLRAADALKRAQEGWQFIAVGSELKMMLDGAAEITRQLDGRETADDLAKY